MDRQWYVKRNQRTHGPFTSKQLRALAREGKITPDTLLSPDGTRWVAASRVRNLFPSTETGRVDAGGSRVSVPLDGVVVTPEREDWMRQLRHQPFGASFAFQSADPNFLTSSKLELIREAIRGCKNRQDQLRTEAGEFDGLKRKVLRSRRLLGWVPFSSAIFKERHQVLAAQIDYYTKQYQEAKSRVSSSGIELEVNLTQAQSSAYNQCLLAFHALAGCNRAWDITAASKIDQFRERTLASTALDRRPVSLSVSEFPSVRCKYQALQFSNQNGHDLYLYPVVWIVGRSEYNFAVLDPREVSVECARIGFHEEDGVPMDTEIIGTTWKRANKDGSRDRRFANNYEIPVVRYAELHFQSATGLNEMYMFSNYDNAQRFSESVKLFQQSLNSNPAC